MIIRNQSFTHKNILLGSIIVVALILAFYTKTLPEGQVGIIGLTPIFALAILSICGLDIVLSVIVAILLGAIMTATTPTELGTLLAASTGSFIATVGLIIMLGAGVGEVATRTGAARELVKFIVNQIGLSSQRRVKIGIIISSIIICGSLGTMAGGNAIIVAVIIPVAAAVGLTPPTVAILLMTAGSIGLFIGPFTPSTVTILELGGLTYPQFLIHAGLPMSVVTLIAGWIMANKIQHWTVAGYKYEQSVLENNQQNSSNSRSKLAALIFFITILVMAVIGVVIQAGFSFAIIVMLTVATLTGLFGGLAPKEILQAMYKGCSQLVWMFLLYWLYNPVLVLVDKLSAYQALLNDVTPYLQGLSPAWLCFFIFLFNIIGHVPGAAVAQMTFTKKIFGPILVAHGVSPEGITAVLLASSQVDWFGPFPSSDMFGQMGLARSNALKYMLYGGWAIVIANIILFGMLFHIIT